MTDEEMHGEWSYLRLLLEVMNYGKDRGDRTGVGTRGLFGRQMRFDLRKGFPLLTTKKVNFTAIVNELLWFISGSTDNKKLNEMGTHIWDEWATKEQTAKFNREEGDLGPVYGHQWRNFGAHRFFNGKYDGDGVDQIANVLREAKANPNSRRLIVTGWNPKEVNDVSLPPCHTLFQFYIQDGEVSCHLYQRSGDLFLGVPFNIASYALLTLMVAHHLGLKPGEFVHSFGDVHIYKNHFTQVKTQLDRRPNPFPTVTLNPKVTRLFDITAEDIWLNNYDSHPYIKAPVAI